jgi:hypothetical protein
MLAIANTCTATARFFIDLVRIREKSVTPFSGEVVEKILCKAELSGIKPPHIALAACILSRLSWRFIRDWKNKLLALHERDFLTAPEVIVMAALYLARSWLDDGLRIVKCYESSAQKVFLATQMCILDDPSTSLLGFTGQDVDEMMEDMALPAHRIGSPPQVCTRERFYAKLDA